MSATEYFIDGVFVGTFNSVEGQQWRFTQAVEAEARSTNRYCSETGGSRIRDVVVTDRSVEVFVRERGAAKSEYQLNCEARGRLTVDGMRD